VARCTK